MSHIFLLNLFDCVLQFVLYVLDVAIFSKFLPLLIEEVHCQVLLGHFWLSQVELVLQEIMLLVLE